MARLRQALHLRQLAQRLAASELDCSNRQGVIFGSLARLQKARPRLVASLRAIAGQHATRRFRQPKLKLWRTLATPDQVLSSDLELLLRSLKQTEAWKQACKTDEQRRSALTPKRWNHEARIHDATDLIINLQAAFQPNQAVKLFFWHHFDAVGFVPLTWKNVLATLVEQGWVVVVSSSKLQTSVESALKQTGCLISRRENLGLCLGAYRDFCCLLNDHRSLRDRIKTLVLCNDSTLALGGAKPFCLQTEAIHQQLKTCGAKLIGLTDSVETNAYHIQTYFLAINSALLRDPNWTIFWNRFDLSGDKDDLIQRGEVGLSQWLLSHRIPLEAKYSLVSILLREPAIHEALRQLGIRNPKQINTTLMCWKALLKAGYPLIKKQLLLEPPDFLPQTVPMAELSAHLTAADHNLVEDLEHLVQSRFLKP